MININDLNKCIEQSKDRNDPTYTKLATKLIVECQGKSEAEIIKNFELVDVPVGKEVSYLILKFGLLLINLIGNRHSEDILTAYTVGSVSGGYCKNGKQQRIVFEYVPTENHTLSGLRITPTGMVMPDLDLEIIVRSNSSEAVKKTVVEIYENLKIKYLEFLDIPVDIRIIDQIDLDYYLHVSEKPSYSIFRLLFGPPLCLYNQTEFSQILDRATKLILDNHNQIDEVPEWRMWNAYMDEIKMIKGLTKREERFFPAEELKTMGDLYWFYSLRINTPNEKNPSNFPPDASSKSFKMKFGYH